MCVSDGSHFKLFSLFNEWVGFAHFKAGMGCKYLSLAQWIKDAFCPVGVPICLTRWINYCTLKTERRKKRNAKTQHAVRIRCVSCDDWMFCQCKRHMVYSKKMFVSSQKSQTENKKTGTFAAFPPSCHNILLIPSVSKQAFPVWTFLTQTSHHVKLASCARHQSWPDTILYTLNKKQQVLLVSQSSSETKIPCCHNLRTILSSAILPVFSFLGVSAAKPPMARTCVWLSRAALCLHDDGVVMLEARSYTRTWA